MGYWTYCAGKHVFSRRCLRIIFKSIIISSLPDLLHGAWFKVGDEELIVCRNSGLVYGMVF